METVKVKLTFIEEALGTSPSDPEVHEKFIASKSPDTPTREQEIAAIGAEEVVEKSITIFPRDENGNLIYWDYQIRGMFKDACGMLARAEGTHSSKLTAYKKVIDGLVFVKPRAIKINLAGPIGRCQRPLRVDTAQGPRVALAHSETVPAGSWIEFEVVILPAKKKPDLKDCLIEWLDYGALRGLSQWRNSGKGAFTYEILD